VVQDSIRFEIDWTLNQVLRRLKCSQLEGLLKSSKVLGIPHYLAAALSTPRMEGGTIWLSSLTRVTHSPAYSTFGKGRIAVFVSASGL
jgi:hypothetical protein